MHVVMGWFSRRARPSFSHDSASVDSPAARVARTLDAVVPGSYRRHQFGGADWGLTVCEIGERSAWRWPVLAGDGPVSAVSLGIPLGASGDALTLARCLLAGDDIHATVAPPFGLLALDGDRRISVQQDWLGMCRIFLGEADDTVFLATRPGLVADLIGRTPDRAGWASYVACGHFGGEFSPYAGVRLLAPGERLLLDRRTEGGWNVASQIRTTIDDVVQRGVAARSKPFEEILDLAAQGITTATAGITRIYGEPITMGLSGGKDSRLVLATMLAAGIVPKLRTNIDTPAEGETAGRLVEIMRERRGLVLDHTLTLVGEAESVVTVGLEDRVQRLQALHDYQFPSTYTVRNTGNGKLPEAATPATVTGAGGELATGYWYPAVGSTVTEPLDALTARLMYACGKQGPTAAVFEAERTRVAALIERGAANGLQGLELVDYIYLLERVRRWYSSAYTVGMVTPFLTPDFLTAAFALTPQQKRERALHTALMQRFTPEWAGVPYVSITTGPSTAFRIWNGDGLQVVHRLLDTVDGGLTDLMRRDSVADALVTCADGKGTGTLQKVLQQFAAIAIATKDFEPGRVRPPSQTYQSFLRTHRRRTPRLAPFVRQMRRTVVGRAVVSAIKTARGRR